MGSAKSPATEMEKEIVRRFASSKGPKDMKEGYVYFGFYLASCDKKTASVLTKKRIIIRPLSFEEVRYLSKKPRKQLKKK